MMKSCELCKMAARTYCESDQASLCWDCDAKVHGANFLVARHVRCLLCQTCQSLTPWRAAGAKLGQTISVCECCVNRGEKEESEGENSDEDGDDQDEEQEADSNDDVSVGAGAENGDNQVMPWFTVTNTPPPATSSSSTSSEDYCGSEGEVSKSTSLFSLKRLRDNASDLPYQEYIASVSPKRRCDLCTVLETRKGRLEDRAVSVDSMKPLKDQQINTEGSTVQLQSDERDAKIL